MTHAEEAARRGAVVVHRVGEYMVRVWYTGPEGYRWEAVGDHGDTLTGTKTAADYESAVMLAELAVLLTVRYR